MSSNPTWLIVRDDKRYAVNSDVALLTSRDAKCYAVDREAASLPSRDAKCYAVDRETASLPSCDAKRYAVDREAASLPSRDAKCYAVDRETASLPSCDAKRYAVDREAASLTTSCRHASIYCLGISIAEYLSKYTGMFIHYMKFQIDIDHKKNEKRNIFFRLSDFLIYFLASHRASNCLLLVVHGFWLVRLWSQRLVQGFTDPNLDWVRMFKLPLNLFTEFVNSHEMCVHNIYNICMYVYTIYVYAPRVHVVCVYNIYIIYTCVYNIYIYIYTIYIYT